jgi:hypothetical protein
MEIAIPPKMNTALPIGLAVVANRDMHRKTMINKVTNPHIHTFLGIEGKNNAHLLDR